MRATIASLVAVAMVLAATSSAYAEEKSPPGDAAQRALQLRVPEQKSFVKNPGIWIGGGVALAGLGLIIAAPIQGTRAAEDAGTCPTRACADDAVDRARAADIELYVGIGLAITGAATAIVSTVVTAVQNRNIERRFAAANPTRR